MSEDFTATRRAVKDSEFHRLAVHARADVECCTPDEFDDWARSAIGSRIMTEGSPNKFTILRAFCGDCLPAFADQQRALGHCIRDQITRVGTTGNRL